METRESGSNSKDEDEPLYFSKEGIKPLLGLKQPSAFAWSYPWPPSPTNLGKNKVFRPKEEDTEKAVEEARIQFEAEAKPLGVSLEVKSLAKMIVPEIELAIYWDRHPFEFRPSSNALQRAKSAANLSVSELLYEKWKHSGEESSIPAASSLSEQPKKHVRRDSHSGSASKRGNGSGGSSRKNSAQGVEVEDGGNRSNGKNNKGSEGSVNVAAGFPSNGNEKPSRSGSGETPQQLFIQSMKEKVRGSVDGTRSRIGVGSPPVVPEEKKVESQKIVKNCTKEQLDLDNHLEKEVLESQSQQPEKEKTLKMKSKKSECGWKDVDRPRLVRPLKTDGAEGHVTDPIKSTYLCPLHGQYNKGRERRAKSGFRTQMGPGGRVVPKLVRSVESQTPSLVIGGVGVGVATAPRCEGQGDLDLDLEGKVTAMRSGDASLTRAKQGIRSKTAGPIGKPKKKSTVQLSEYNGNFRHPGQIAETENRILRHKILSRCFTKHSIF